MGKNIIEKLVTGKKGEVKLLQNLYGDFNKTLTDIVGDTGKTLKKHKVLVLLAFLGFLYFRNKQFSIAEFVKKLEERIKGQAREKDW